MKKRAVVMYLDGVLGEEVVTLAKTLELSHTALCAALLERGLAALKKDARAKQHAHA